MIVVDTTVLAYAVGEVHEFQRPSRLLLDAVAAGHIEATTTVEVIQEFAHVRERRRARSDAVALARDFADLLSPLLIVERGDLDRGLSLFERHSDLGSFDSVLAATAVARGAEALVTADEAFRAVPKLRVIALDPAAVGELLNNG